MPSTTSPGERVNSQQLVPPLSNEVERKLEEYLGVAREYGVANELNRVVVEPANPWLTIVAAGHTFVATVEALQAIGLNFAALAANGVRLVKLGMLYPLDPASIRTWARDVEQVLVVEEKRPFVEAAVRDALYGGPHQPAVLGKKGMDGTRLIPGDGALGATGLVQPLHDVLLSRLAASTLTTPSAAKPMRTTLTLNDPRAAFFCSGCPHTTSLKVPEGTTVGAGIGCHGMIKALPQKRVGDIATVTHMGGEGAQWIGIEPFIGPTPFVQNLGDGTLFHSGYLAIRFAVASGAHLTYKILYNSAVAMTGGQDAVGGLTVPNLCSALLAEGVSAIVITTEDVHRYRRVSLPAGVKVLDRSEIIPAQRELAQIPGVTVLVHDQACAAELRRHRKAGKAPTPDHRLVINQRVL